MAMLQKEPSFSLGSTLGRIWAPTQVRAVGPEQCQCKVQLCDSGGHQDYALIRAVSVGAPKRTQMYCSGFGPVRNIPEKKPIKMMRQALITKCWCVKHAELF